MKYKFSGNSGMSSQIIESMEKHLTRQGLSTTRLDPTHKFENPTVKQYDKQCPICRVHFKSKLLRCPKCDIIVAGKKPTGTDAEQKEYIQEYASEMHKLDKERKLILKTHRDEVRDGMRKRR